ncbi:MAG: MFS transporter [Pseudomonadota bacterium]
MSTLAKIALLFVVFIDIIGQGLVFPIINTLIMEPTSGFLPSNASDATRHLNYGLVIGIFFLSWFIGAPYISKLSDVIGRKPAILICLFGALAGYAITIVSLYTESLILLILGRAITGFTAGNQPIAQAAMIDGSTDETDRARNMGYIITGVSFGLVGGPIIGGFLSDPTIVGSIASLKLPFFAAFALVVIAILLVVFAFTDSRQQRDPFVFRPFEVFEILWRVSKFPLVIRICMVFVFFHIANVTFYIFIENYMTSRFGFETFGNSMVMLVIGFALAFSSTFLVTPTLARFSKQTVILANFVVWGLCGAAIILIPYAWMCFIPIFCFYFIFGVSYPTFLSMFSASVSDEEQGWVMGITIAMFTMVGGIMSLLGGELMSIDIYLPFYIVVAATVIGVLVMSIVWNKPEIHELTDLPKEE